MKPTEFTYLVLGAALGVAAAIWLAPKSGSETRKHLQSTANQGTDYVKTHASDLRAAASRAIKHGKKGVRQQAENLTAALDAGVQTYREAVETTPG